MNKAKDNSLYGKSADFTTWKYDIMSRLLDSGKFSAEETAKIIIALQSVENEKKHVAHWISSPCGNAENYACSHCNFLLLPDIRPERPEDSPFNVQYYPIYIAAYCYCPLCGYKMQGIKKHSLKKDWVVKWDD